MNDSEGNLVIFLIFIALFIGGCIGNFAAHFGVPALEKLPSAIIFNSDTRYQHRLIADTIVCNPLAEMNASYYSYDTVAYNQSEYVIRKRQVGNESAKGIIVCK